MLVRWQNSMTVSVPGFEVAAAGFVITRVFYLIIIIMSSGIALPVQYFFDRLGEAYGALTVYVTHLYANL